MALLSLLSNFWKDVVLWCKHHKQLVAAAVGAFVGVYVASRGKAQSPEAQGLEAEQAAANTALSIKEVAIEQGAAAAHQKVAEQYQETLANLDKASQDKAAALLGDPVALAKFLVNKSEPK